MICEIREGGREVVLHHPTLLIELVKAGNDGGQPLENQISMLDEKGGAK